MNNCWITLGANGDILNTLPLVYRDFTLGNKPTFMVSEAYKDLLDGVSYSDRIVWPGHYSEANQALNWAVQHHKFDNIYLAQCYGTKVERRTDSYCKEAWRLVGMLDHWGKLPLVFDLRNLQREQAVLDRYNTGCFADKSKPLVLLCREGKSSPFPPNESDALYQVLEPLEDDFNFVNLDVFRAPKFFDLLGLFERASLLITIDTGPLHLANAVPQLPVIALASDRPDLWHGSPRRENHIAYIRYGEFDRRKSEIVSLVKGSDCQEAPRLIHVWSDYHRPEKGAQKRHRMAARTWDEEYKHPAWSPLPVHESAMGRNANTIGEMKPVPFVKDLLQSAVDRAYPGDIIVFSNDDTCFAPGITHTILDLVPKHGALWGARREHKRIERPLSKEELVRGYQHCGSDIFAFTKKWWEINNHDFPDFVLTFEAWDLVLKKLILLTGGIEVRDTCYHEIHESFWHVSANRECPGNLYNRELTRQWLARHQIRWEDAFK